MKDAIPFLLSFITIWGMWEAGNQRVRAWVISLVNQAFWFVFIVTYQAWGLLILNLALVIVYTRNIMKWRADGLE